MKKYVLLSAIFLTAVVVSCALIEPPDLGNTFGSSSSSTSSSSSEPSTATNYTSPNIGTLIYVPAGAFQYDGTAGDVCTISAAFHMSKNDITGTEFQNVTGITDPSHDSSVYNHPVENVTWYEALVFCNDLSIAEGLTPVYTINGSMSPSVWGTIPTSDNATWDAVQVNWSANGYRLPTELEYMWAAMGATNDTRAGDIVGGTNMNGYSKGYAGSQEPGNAYTYINSYAWGPPASHSSAEGVGLLLPNELGLYDMSENVWQWCWDAWDSTTMFGTFPYTGSLIDPTGFSGQAWASGFSRVIRGSSYGNGNDASEASLTFRGNQFPSDSINDFSFRVVRP